MDHQAKVAHLLEDFKRRGIQAYSTAPPLYRLLWRMGIEVPPPHFGSFGSITLIMGLYFGVFWGLAMWFLVWRGDDMPIAIAVTASVLAGLLFGAIMAVYFRWRARKLGLPSWKDYPASN
jgi:membrane associated rhomboid family serine protease